MTAIRTGAQRVQRRRDKLRATGPRPVQIWVADTRAAGFTGECARQARLIRASETPESRAEDEAWLEASDTSGWTAWGGGTAAQREIGPGAETRPQQRLPNHT